jgi:hypothetical protein
MNVVYLNITASSPVEFGSLARIEIDFAQDVVRESGKNVSVLLSETTLASYPITDFQYIEETNTLQIDRNLFLDAVKTYSALAEEGALTDTCSFASPAKEGTVEIISTINETYIDIDFCQPIQKGTGTIKLYETNSATLIETIDVESSQVTLINDDNGIRITPNTKLLDSNVSHHVIVDDPGIVVDNGGFVAPAISTSTDPGDGSYTRTYSYSTINGDIIIEFDDPITLDSLDEDDITLLGSDLTTFFTCRVTDDNVSVTGNRLAINVDLVQGETYHLEINDNCIVSLEDSTANSQINASFQVATGVEVSSLTGRQYDGNNRNLIFSTSTPEVESAWHFDHTITISSPNGKFGTDLQMEDAETEFSFTGSVAECNTLIEDLVFFPTSGFTGSTTYTFKVLLGDVEMYASTQNLTNSGSNTHENIYTFSESGTYNFAPSTLDNEYGSGTFDLLIVGGGGAGSSLGGGAAGLVQEVLTITTPTTPYDDVYFMKIIIGAGGQGNTELPISTGNSGTSSYVYGNGIAYSAAGGNGGTFAEDITGYTLLSGGSNDSFTGGTGQHINGRILGGGGAGSSANGNNASSTSGGDGGAGTYSSLLDSYVAGGGGGACAAVYENAGSGVNGGGNGDDWNNLLNVGNGSTAGSGGGGGGAGLQWGGSGADGIVVLRFR